MVIYKITNKINGKIYIGQTIAKVCKRWSAHRKINKSTISKAIHKYGSGNFLFEVIDGANSLSELNYLEQHYIYMFNSLSPNGYNIKNGGNNVGPTPETIKKIADKKRGVKTGPRTEEFRKKLSEMKKGIPLSKEVLEKVTKTRRETPQTEKQRANLLKMIEGNKGRKYSKEHREKISKATTGKSKNRKKTFTSAT